MLVFVFAIGVFVVVDSRQDQRLWTRSRNEDAWEELQRRLIPKSSSASLEEAESTSACVRTADVQEETIIRTNVSRVAGADFLDTFDVSSRADCVRRCCRMLECNLAVVDVKRSAAKCFLFDCKHPSVCRFTPHRGYASVSLPKGAATSQASHVRRVNVPPPDKPPAVAETTTTSTTTTMRTTTSTSSLMDDEPEADLRSLKTGSQLDGTVSPLMLSEVIKLLKSNKVLPSSTTSTTTTAPTTTTTTSPPSENNLEATFEPDVKKSGDAGVSCHREFELRCADGVSCVALNDICDGFAQCGDGSDEDDDLCRGLKAAESRESADSDDGVHSRDGRVHGHRQVSKATTTSTPPSTAPLRTSISSWSSSSSLPRHSVDDLHGNLARKISELDPLTNPRLVLPDPPSSTEAPPSTTKPKSAAPSATPSLKNASNQIISLNAYLGPVATESQWRRAHADEAFVRRNASVALASGLLLVFAFLVFVSLKFKLHWITGFRGRGRRGAQPNGEADYLINGMYL